ncbi:WD40-repeat-containing domain protein [Roridomyces roridus]|uniref:WD40-repeat-containing domain protein n=1 Tax=Roridomyces roridus TaxID=1738132 RepID=A0AAD7CJH4_9AGAR|nr:WD40-repeat-containing domain protein [Roridomyces roridus]
MPVEDIPIFRKAAVLPIHSNPVGAIAISPDGMLATSAADDGVISIFLTKTPKYRQLIRYPTFASIRALVWHPRTKLLSFGTVGGTLGTFCPVVDPESTSSDPLLHTAPSLNKRTFDDPIHCLTIRADGRYLASNARILVRRYYQLLDAHPPSAPQEFQLHPLSKVGDRDLVNAAVFHTDQSIVLVGYYSGRVIAFKYSTDPATVRQLWAVDRKCACGPSVLSPSGEWIVGTSLTGNVVCVGTASPHTIKTFKLPDPVYHWVNIAFISKTAFAVGSEAGAVEIIEMHTKTVGKRIRIESGSIQSLPHNDKLVQCMVRLFLHPNLKRTNEIQAYWTTEDKRSHILITGTSELDQPGTLTIWKAQRASPVLSRRNLAALAIAGAMISATPIPGRWIRTNTGNRLVHVELPNLVRSASSVLFPAPPVRTPFATATTTKSSTSTGLLNINGRQINERSIDSEPFNLATSTLAASDRVQSGEFSSTMSPDIDSVLPSTATALETSAVAGISSSSEELTVALRSETTFKPSPVSKSATTDRPTSSVSMGDVDDRKNSWIAFETITKFAFYSETS